MTDMETGHSSQIVMYDVNIQVEGDNMLIDIVVADPSDSDYEYVLSFILESGNIEIERDNIHPVSQ